MLKSWVMPFRTILIHGAIGDYPCEQKKDRLSLWINRIVAERGKNKAAVAVANKMARKHAGRLNATLTPALPEKTI